MYCVSCVFESHSHNLSESAFSILMSDDNLSKVRRVDKRYVELLIRAEKEYFDNPDKFYLHAHGVASNFLMALNVACLGHFTWANATQLSPVYEIENEGNPEGNKILFLPRRKYPIDTIDITEKEVRNALILSGALLGEEDQNIRREYVRGIVHLGLVFGDVNFDKEAFSNFYRLFEYLTTKRIKKKQKLSNELKELKAVIIDSGLSGEVADEFKKLYQLRSEQVMHAQQEQVSVLLDDVLKMKKFLDFVLFKYYKTIANSWLLKHRKESLTRQIQPTSFVGG